MLERDVAIVVLRETSSAVVAGNPSTLFSEA